jgi:hypothetical protein
METVTTYKCDRCGRSEIKDGVTILTLTIRKRAGKNIPGQGVSEFTRHVCLENCLKIVKASMTPVGIAGHYDRTAAAQRRKAAREAASTTPTPTETQPAQPTKSQAKSQTRRILVNKQTGKPAKVATRKAQTPVSRTHTASESPSASQGRAEAVRAVRAITRKPNGGGWAKGYNNRIERKMIAEREALSTPGE